MITLGRNLVELLLTIICPPTSTHMLKYDSRIQLEIHGHFYHNISPSRNVKKIPVMSGNPDFHDHMGRHRTSRAKEKLIRSVGGKRKFDSKRNRDLKLKEKRAAFVKSRAERIRRNQKVLYGYEPNINIKKGDLDKVKKEINQTFLDRVERVQSSYGNFFSVVDEANAVIEVLDARDPYSFRYVDMERHVKASQKPFFFVLTKIDLVPAEIVMKWTASLSCLAPTVAVCVMDAASTATIVKQVIGEVQGVAVVGAPGVGKTGLCAAVGEQLVDTESWHWTLCNNSLALTNSVPWKGRIREFAVETLERVQNDTIFRLMDIKMENTAGNALVSYARKVGVSKQEAPEAFLSNFLNGTWKWCSVAPEFEEDAEVPALSEIQMQIIQNFSQASIDDYVVFGKGELIKADKTALEFVIPEPDSDESESAEYEESDEEGQEGFFEEEEEE